MSMTDCTLACSWAYHSASANVSRPSASVLLTCRRRACILDPISWLAGTTRRRAAHGELRVVASMHVAQLKTSVSPDMQGRAPASM